MARPVLAHWPLRLYCASNCVALFSLVCNFLCKKKRERNLVFSFYLNLGISSRNVSIAVP